MTPGLELYEGSEILGIVRGSNRGTVAIEAITPGWTKGPPQRGDFLLLEQSGGRALVARVVAARAGGPFGEGKESGASYLAELLKTGANTVPENVREMLYRLHLDLHVLGALEASGQGLRFDAGRRDLDPFGHRLRRPSKDALRYLASAGQMPGKGVVPFGVLCRGSQLFDDVPVLFSIDRLKGRRSFVFARAGYGKSNLVKFLISRLYESPPEVGLLIIDPEGEYAFRPSGSNVPGLADHPEIRKRLKVFTARKDPELLRRYGEVIEPSLKIDFRKCEPGEVLTSFVPREKLEQVWTNFVRGLARRKRGGAIEVENRWARLVDMLDEKRWRISDDELEALFFGKAGQHGERSPKAREGNVSLQAVRNNLVPLIGRLHDPERDLIGKVTQHMAMGNVAVLDVSLEPHQDARAIADLLLYRLFNDRVRGVTEGTPRTPVLAVFEEAQTMLSRQEPDTSIFVRWVKEGRKYGLGALMITQQPGSIAEGIVAQGDNFFVMHLLAEGDLLLLQRLNAHFTDDILEYIRTEPVRGNCYFWSAPDQPYVVPCRVANYDDSVAGVPKRSPVTKARSGKVAKPARAELSELQRAVLHILATRDRVYLVQVESFDGERGDDLIAVSKDYLHREIENWLVQEPPIDGENNAASDPRKVLAALGVLAHPDYVRGDYNSVAREWLVLRRAALANVCHRAGYALKPVVERPIALRSR